MISWWIKSCCLVVTVNYPKHTQTYRLLETQCLQLFRALFQRILQRIFASFQRLQHVAMCCSTLLDFFLWYCTERIEIYRTMRIVYFLPKESIGFEGFIFRKFISSFYRPQRSCGKVMFLHLSVILFTGGGGPLSGGVSVRGGGGVTCGRYASCWNIFIVYQTFVRKYCKCQHF